MIHKSKKWYSKANRIFLEYYGGKIYGVVLALWILSEM